MMEYNSATKKEHTIDTHNMDKSQEHYTKWKKADLLHYFI
jgi:hypothetical protein